MTPAWVGASSAVIVAAAGFAVFVTRILWQLHTRASDFFDDWAGAPSRPGVEARAGVMARLRRLEVIAADIQMETQPNDGTSMRDDIRKNATLLQEVKTEQAAVRGDLVTYRHDGE